MQHNDHIMKLFYKDLPILVTGGAGFIGSHLVTKLVALGAQVTILDDFSSGSMTNLSGLEDNITIIHGSITDSATCLHATRGKSVIFHLAAFISVPDSLTNPLPCYMVNIQGTLNVLEACRKNNVERFIFSSSAAIYGSTQEICRETSNPHPESPYGTSKLIGELLCQQYASNYDLKTVCLRYFNVYGDRQNPNGAYAAVVAKFNYQLRNNLPITIFGDGSQTRDFVPVDQVVEANLLLAMLSDNQMTGQPYNIATGKSIKLIDLLEQLKEEYPHYNTQIRYAHERAGDIKHSHADCKKYRIAVMELGNYTHK